MHMEPKYCGRTWYNGLSVLKNAPTVQDVLPPPPVATSYYTVNYGTMECNKYIPVLYMYGSIPRT